MVTVKIIGALGYGGVGMVEVLLRHPQARIKRLVDVEGVGTPISDIWPHLAGYCDAPISGPDEHAPGETDVVFTATPDGVGQKTAPAELKAGARLVDYSGDFRFDTPEVYRDYAQRIGRDGAHGCPDLLPKSVYGLAELHRPDIAKAQVVGNPGCFATATILGLAPVARARSGHG
jgi:N-acetyl-gamma-glutamyl-phosphate reductase